MSTILLASAGAAIGMGGWFVLSGVLGRPLLPDQGRAELRSLPVKRLSAAITAGVVVFAATGWLAAAGLLFLGIAVFQGRLGSRSELQMATERAEAIASWTEMVYSTIAAGGGIERALVASSRTAPKAIRAEVNRLAARLEVHALPDALRHFAAETAHPSADKVAAALLLASAHGSHDLVALLRTQVESTRLEAKMTLEVEAGRARYRTSARIVVGVTVAMAVGLYVADRGYLAPYDTTVGQMVLVCVGAVFMLGFWLLIRMGDAPEADRYFAGIADEERVSG
jgi:tight adherence protein B